MDAITVLGWFWFFAAGVYFVFCNSSVLRLYPKKIISAALPLVVSAVRSVADSDEVWTHFFLPSDCQDILAQAVHPLQLFSSKKELYFRLCDPILIQGGLKSFALEKHSGAKCYTLSARDLSIAWGDNCQYWKWVSLPESRFAEVAELVEVCWLDITGKIDSRVLSPRTYYKAYMIFKLLERDGGFATPQLASVGVGPHVTENSVSLQLENQPPPAPAAAAAAGNSIRIPRVRNDWWLEIELGGLYNVDGSNGEVTMSFKDLSPNWKRGLVVEGIQLRPN